MKPNKSTTSSASLASLTSLASVASLASRRRWLGSVAIGASLASLGGQTLDSSSVAAADDPFTPQIEQSIGRGLAFLARSQTDSGYFSDARGKGMGDNVAVVALAGLAMLSSGSLPRRGPWGQQLDRCVNFIAKACDPSTGLIVNDASASRSSMYGHGFASLFLAEVYGTINRDDLQRKLNSAIGLIVRSQNSDGGWRYDPQPRDADLSVTICQMMALRAARNAGIYVPGEVIRQAVDFVRRCQNPDGGFMYQITGGESRYPLTAGAIVALQNAGRYQGKELDDAYAYLSERPNEYLSPLRSNYFFYAHYYSVQAFYQLGAAAWLDWYHKLAGTILKSQLVDGSWLDYTDRFYATTMAIIILNTPRSLLPIFQR